MNWATRLWARLYPKERLDELPTFDQVRFVTLVNIGWFGIPLLALLIAINLVFKNYDRALNNLVTISLYVFPTLWLTYRYKLKLASWYWISTMYVAAVWGLYTRLLAHVDVHIEMYFIMIALFSILLLEGKISVIVSILMAISYATARLLVFRQLNLPFEIGQFNSGIGVFIVLTYVTYTVKKIAGTIQEVVQQQYKQLQQKNHELGELNHVKDKLFAIIGHDLRSPIVSLKIQLMNVQKGYATAQQYEKASAQLQQTVDGVFVTLDNLLNWALLQRGGIRVHPTHFDLSEIGESILQLYSAELPGKQLTVTTHYETAPVAADEHQVTIIARNLLHNAIKFTPKGGHIQLSTRQQNGRSQFIIQDSGIGMTAAEQLEQTTSIGATSYGTAGEKGTGLGLEISREFVRLNKGQLLIDSIPGQGTTVTVEF
ncbi:HAMP domain-containing histidine kinase [Spirosoma sp. KCTC 42546]|uniref:sensor histidine kinase n=1 Tax=Spirosoma sp. KCTC 42546 TaxID=2520506 RepID=UPI00115B1C8E|nr:HAMP domain-containing sensor histidine kinase [Spirosoma sp. KCTC 42546]QDK77191.1 HAMP domain-containing histidine kinase [Spirosoma sp. KCTC 42546]